MQTLINLNPNLIQNHHGHALISSVALAHLFNKRHSQLVNIIEGLEYSDSFLLKHFVTPSGYTPLNHVARDYQVSETGFLILTSGFNGKRATRLKESILNLFNTPTTQAQPEAKPSQAKPTTLYSKLKLVEAHGFFVAVNQ